MTTRSCPRKVSIRRANHLRTVGKWVRNVNYTKPLPVNKKEIYSQDVLYTFKSRFDYIGLHVYAPMKIITNVVLITFYDSIRVVKA